MCYSAEMSAGFALTGVAMAAYLRYVAKKPVRPCLTILYFASMELLQTVQYFWIAEPDDGYAMCENPVNQFLTVLGVAHIWFQPVFKAWMSPRDSIKDRIQLDLIIKFSLLGAFCMALRYFLTWLPDNPYMAPRPTRDCPNYEWLRDGYDGSLGDFETPNLPGHSCTFRSPTSSGHLAWASPMYQATYFLPGVGVHFFLMVGQMVARAESFAAYAVIPVFVLTGPGLAVYLTSSVNEQAAIWCYFSVFQVFFSFIEQILKKPKPIKKLVNVGTLDDVPLEYVLVSKNTNGHVSNGNSSNEKKAV